MLERLHKLLARAGVGSRRECEALIAEGRVSVDGATVTELGTQVDAGRQAVKVDGGPIRLPEPAFFLLNKPRGVVCTASAEEHGARAVDFAPKKAGRLHTIGRLDRESEGLLILTNDGALTERLTHPRHDIPKTYHVLVRGRVGAETIARLKKGIWLAEGRAAVSAIAVRRATPAATLLEVELREGKNREIRRIMARVGHPVKELRRVAIGPIRIGGLERGRVRPLSSEEVRLLKEAVGLERPGLAAEARKRGGKVPATSRADAPGSRERPRARTTEGPASPPKSTSPPAQRTSPVERAKRRTYVPDEDGVIVIRRPRFSEEE